MSVQKHLASSAEVRPLEANRLVRVMDSENPEIIFVKALRDYFLEVGFSETYSHFGNLNIGAVHPFILLLFADVMGDPQDLNVFPSITVADSSQDESNQTLAREVNYLILHAADIQVFKNYRDQNKVFISDNGLYHLEQGTLNNQTLVGQQTIDTALHVFDFNIWSTNKDVTSLIYDMVDSFLTAEIGNLHLKDIDIQSKSGRRSGDVNLEFGKILYGSNITVNATVRRSSMVVNPVIGTITEIDVKTLPQYFISGGA